MGLSSGNEESVAANFFSSTLPESKCVWPNNFSDHHESLSSRIRNFILTSWLFLVGLLEYQRVNVLDNNVCRVPCDGLNMFEVTIIQPTLVIGHCMFKHCWFLHCHTSYWDCKFGCHLDAWEVLFYCIWLTDVSGLEKSNSTVFDWQVYQFLGWEVLSYCIRLTDISIPGLQKSYIFLLYLTDWHQFLGLRRPVMMNRSNTSPW